MTMLEHEDAGVVETVMELVNQLVRDDGDVQQRLALVGMIPAMMRFAGPAREPAHRLQAARFACTVCRTRTAVLHMFAACGGLKTVVDLLRPSQRAAMQRTPTLERAHTESPLRETPASRRGHTRTHTGSSLDLTAHVNRHSSRESGFDVASGALLDRELQCLALDCLERVFGLQVRTPY